MTLRVVLFSGGRGARSIALALASHPQIDLTVLVNAYDDGLSTGRIRGFVGGMLGPSDVRKNAIALAPSDRRHAALRGILEHRLPKATDREAGLAVLNSLAERDPAGLPPTLRTAYPNLTVAQADVLADWAAAFESFAAKAQGGEDLFGDCSVANLLFAGCFLRADRDFNEAVSLFCALCETRGSILNVTDGANLVLVALKAGELLRDESAIVAPQSQNPIEELFLLERYLSDGQREELAGLTPPERSLWLRAREERPAPNPVAIRALREANLIVYGPGTQHSSLLPSYLTRGVAEAIAANGDAEKVFVANILEDHDIQQRTVQELLEAFSRNMNRKGELELPSSRLVTRLFAQMPDRADMGWQPGGTYVPLDAALLDLEQSAVTARDWEHGSGGHAGGLIVDELLRIARQLLAIHVRPFRHTVSVVVPALNEAKTVQGVLRQLREVDWSALEVGSEVILVDGGSTDGTLELALREKGVRVYQLQGKASGRGAALRMGASKARGNVLVFFPADGEYDPQDVLRVARPILAGEFDVVFGSRAIKCANLSERARQIYGDDSLGYVLGKYGGVVLSMLSLLLYNRFVTDPLTSLKAIDRSLFESLELRAEGVDLETELIARLCERQVLLLEIPVAFRPRTRAEGKKTRLRDGLRAAGTLVVQRLKFEARRRLS